MNENAGAYAGLDRFQARERCCRTWKSWACWSATKDYTVPLGKCDRCGTIVEPRLSDAVVCGKIDAAGDGSSRLQRPSVESGEITLHAGELQADLFELDGEHPRLVHLAPVVVGTPHSGVALPGLPRDHRGARDAGDARSAAARNWSRTRTCWTPGSPRDCCRCPAMGWPERTRDLEVFYPTTFLITASTSCSSGWRA